MAILVNGVKVAGVGVPGTNGKDATINGMNALTIQSGTTVSVNLSGGVATFEFDGDAADVPFTPGSTGMTATDVQAAITELAGFSGGAQVEAGSYVGTGTYGPSHQTSYTFQSLPKIVFIFGAAGDNAAFGWILPSFSTGSSSYFEYQGYKSLTVSVSGNTVSWYSTSTNPGAQFNSSRETYIIVGIG